VGAELRGSLNPNVDWKGIPSERGLLLDEEATCKKVNFMKLKANIGVLFRISALVSCER